MIIYVKIWIKNMAIFIIFSSLIEGILPSGSYKKYVNMILGLIFILILLKPVTDIIDISEDISSVFLRSRENEEILKTSDLSIIESKKQKLILDNYKTTIKNQIQEILKEEGVKVMGTNIKVNGKTESSLYGSIEKIEITVSKAKVEDIKEVVKEINPVKIEINEKSEMKDVLYIKDMELRTKVKKMIMNFYNLSPNNINVKTM